MYLRLRFDSEAVARLQLAAFVSPDGAWSRPDVLVPIGVLRDPPSVQPDGTAIPGAAQPGWHADLITEDPALVAALGPWTVNPPHPLHVVLGAG